MCRKLIYLTCCVFILGLVGAGKAQEVDPNLVAWWKLDEASGSTAADSAGIYNGTLRGGPTWAKGIVDGALRFDGDNDCVEIGNYPVFNSPRGSFSVTLWANIGSWSSDWMHSMIGNRSDGVGWCLRKFGSWWSTQYPAVYTHPTDALCFTTRGVGHALDGVEDTPTNTVPPLNEWIHIACIYDNVNNKKYIYFNGVEDAAWDTNPGTVTAATQKFYIGARANAGNTAPEALFLGMLDDVRFYNDVLTIKEITTLATPGPTKKADNPNPPDGAVMISSTRLQWKAADVAASHNVYLGTIAILGTADYQGRQQVNSYVHTPGFVSQTTYFWRIDAVEADGVTIHTGDVWSFTTGPAKAFNPNPRDGNSGTATNSDLTWTAGVGAAAHDVYFGTKQADVAAGASSTFIRNQTANSYDPVTMQNDTAYYWRIDEIEANGTKHNGDVWRFRTVAEMPVAGPNLVGWWKLDESSGTTAVDSSGNGNDGTVRGNPLWVEGKLGGALELDGAGDYVDCGTSAVFNIQDEITIAGWIKVAAFNVAWQAIIAKGDNTYRLSSIGSDDFLHFGLTGTNPGSINGVLDVTDDQWHHVAGVYNGAEARIYVDGVLDSNATCTGQIRTSSSNLCIGENAGLSRYLDGLIDDARLYNKALTQDEIKQVMAVDTTKAVKPTPATASITDVEKAVPLSWSPGSKAAKHDVYIGSDAFDVENASVPDNTGIYHGRHDANSYTPPEGINFGQTYYWRIDEVNNDGSTSKGRIWSFTVLPYLIVDDFEGYNDFDNPVFYTWLDCVVNNTGMTVGHTEAGVSFAERTIVNSGRQAMYMHYDNDGSINEGYGPPLEKTGTQLYSETEREWTDPQDWTRKNISSLQLWFRGNYASFGSFTQAGTTFTMTAGGTEIGATSDQFHFAFKRLTGTGTIEAKVIKIDDTDPLAMAGVMFRDTLNPDSKYVMMAISSKNGAIFQRRTTEGVVSEQDSQAGIKAPYWVRVGRLGNNFYGYLSSNGSQWSSIGSVTITMATNPYVGLCLTSHDVEEKCEAQFSNVKITPNVTSPWQSQDIGITSNSKEQLYVVLQDAAGNSSPVVKHQDPAASSIAVWTPWNIPLTNFTGVNLTAIKKMTIGIGDRANTQPGGAGDLYIDDIGLHLPDSGK